MNRRAFLRAAAGVVAAPYVITTAGVLMPVRKLLSASDLTEAALERILNEMWSRQLQPYQTVFLNHIRQGTGFLTIKDGIAKAVPGDTIFVIPRLRG